MPQVNALPKGAKIQYRLLNSSDDSFRRMAIISLTSIVWQDPFDNCFTDTISRHVTLSESTPPGHRNLSSRSLAMQVSATCLWKERKQREITRRNKTHNINLTGKKNKSFWHCLILRTSLKNNLEKQTHSRKHQAACQHNSKSYALAFLFICIKCLKNSTNSLTQTIFENDPPEMTSF